MDELSDFDMHQSNACGGVGHACPFCDAAMDEQRARRIKAEMQRMAVRKLDHSSVATESAE